MLQKILASVLLLAALAIGVGWARGTAAPNGYSPSGDYTADASYMVLFVDNHVRFSHWWYEEGLLTVRDRGGEWLGTGFLVKFIHTPLGQTLQIHRVWLPTWLLMSVVLAYPLVSGLRWMFRQFERKRRFRCSACGYSLIALVEPRCPECGVEVTIPTQAGAADYVDPIVYTRYRFVAAVALLFAISGGGMWWAYSQSRPSAISATPVAGVLPPSLATLAGLPSAIGPNPISIGTNMQALPNSVGVALTQPWFAVYRSSAKSGCPICGPDAPLSEVIISEPMTGSLDTGTLLAYRCDRCQKLLGLDQKKHSFPMACKRCGHVVTDLSGSPSPWCDGCVCPKCQWATPVASPSD